MNSALSSPSTKRSTNQQDNNCHSIFVKGKVRDGKNNCAQNKQLTRLRNKQITTTPVRSAAALHTSSILFSQKICLHNSGGLGILFLKAIVLPPHKVTYNLNVPY